MDIQNKSKDIIRCFLSEAVDQGRLDSFFVSYSETMKSTGIDNKNLFSICLQYLSDKHLIQIVRSDDEDSHLVKMFFGAIDFIET